MAQVANTKQSLIALDFFGDGITREAIKDMIMSFVIDVSSCDSKMIVLLHCYIGSCIGCVTMHHIGLELGSALGVV